MPPPSLQPTLFPLFLNVADRDVLVVGGGDVAERKVRTLLDVHARVRVVAPTASPQIRRWAQAGEIEWRERGFQPVDTEGVWLAVAATSDQEVVREVVTATTARRIFLLAIDDPAHATAYSAAIVRRDPFTIAISSSGATPALTRLIREILEEMLPGPDWVAQARALRAHWIASGKPIGERFGDLVRQFAAREK